MAKYTLVGVDGNAFCIMGYTARAMRRAGFSQEDIDRMHTEATAGDYCNLIVVCDGYIDKVNEALGLQDDEEEE